MEQRQRRAAARVLARGESYRGRLPLIIGGERKPHDVTVMPFEDATAAAAVDVMALEKAQGELERQAVPYDRTLDRVATAVAIFSAPAAARVLQRGLPQAVAARRPSGSKTRRTDGAVLDRLRELSRLPEVVNYREWKAKILSGYGDGTAEDDTWHPARWPHAARVAEKRPDGGVTYLFVDETERFALESDYNALIDVQRETLDSLKEGVAVFATDGRLKLFNSRLRRDLAAVAPRARRGAAHRRVHRCRRASTYDDLADLGAHQPRGHRHSPTSASRVDGPDDAPRPDASSTMRSMPLPDGATLITFADVTDSKRYERALKSATRRWSPATA